MDCPMTFNFTLIFTCLVMKSGKEWEETSRPNEKRKRNACKNHTAKLLKQKLLIWVTNSIKLSPQEY
jgi:hypothetical protein